jgi:hypothetical protein
MLYKDFKDIPDILPNLEAKSAGSPSLPGLATAEEPVTPPAKEAVTPKQTTAQSLPQPDTMRLEKRIGELNQAIRARKEALNALQSKIQVEQQNHDHSMRAAEAKNAELSAKREGIELDVRDLTTARQVATEALLAVRRELQEKQRVLLAEQANLANLRGRIYALEKDLAAANQEIRRLTGRIESVAKLRRELSQEKNSKNSLMEKLQETGVELSKLAATNAVLQKQTGTLRSQNGLLTEENEKLCISLGVAKQENSKLQRKLRENEQPEIAPLSRGKALELFSKPRVCRWLFRERDESTLDIPNAEIVTAGENPMSSPELSKLLEYSGYEILAPGSKSCGVMVVGRDNWFIDDMEAQIRVRKSNDLRIYSQEMLTIALATKDDPFQTADMKTLLEFADGHPALEYLIENGLEWPEVTAAPLLALGEFEYAEESPLRRMGYVVGKAGLPPSRRKAILKKAFEGKLPSVISKEYMETWARPKSRDRLRRIARLIAWLASSHSKMTGHETAVQHWGSDLDWLQHFYEGWMRFRWPEVQVED